MNPAPAAAVAPAPPRAADRRLQSSLQPVIKTAAAANHLSPALLSRTLDVESAFRPDIASGVTRSKAGAVGVAQMMPKTAESLGVDPADPVASVQGAARYIAKLKRRFGGDIYKAMAAYNMGPTALSAVIQKHGARWFLHLTPTVQQYVAEVVGNEAQP